ncbi:MAG: ribosomal L7Ae/L30e/S12e/Gadd45 family protein [Oscillospiraceae bacterium]|nr:ribosomal L7Ae/L30e/S12e/Gadd45 family protein [Oscillospiraceae bacterium]
MIQLNSQNARKLSALGLIKKAGALVAGTELSEKSVKSGKSALVLIASDVSERTAKRMLDACAYYKTEVRISEFTMDEISTAIGLVRPTAAISITRREFLKLVESENRSANNGGISCQKKE